MTIFLRHSFKLRVAFIVRSIKHHWSNFKKRKSFWRNQMMFWRIFHHIQIFQFQTIFYRISFFEYLLWIESYAAKKRLSVNVAIDVFKQKTRICATRNWLRESMYSQQKMKIIRFILHICLWFTSWNWF